MDKNQVSLREQEKLMKSFFTLTNTVSSLRNVINDNPSIAAGVSIKEVYDLVIEVIDLLRFIRQEQDNILPKKNPQIKEDPLGSTQNNPGGLLRIEFPKVRVPLGRWEKDTIFGLQVFLIRIRDQLISGVQPDLSFSVTSDHERVEAKLAQSKANKHYRRLRKTGRG